MQKYIEKRDAFPRPKKANTYRVYPLKGKIVIEFGRLSSKDNSVDVVSSVWIDPKRLPGFAARVVETGASYQSKYNEDIGFNFAVEETNDQGEDLLQEDV